MVQTPVRQITLEQFLLLPETKPASEYIDGQIIQKPMPQGHHSIIQGELLTELTLVLKRKGIATALPELRCTFGDRAIVPSARFCTIARTNYRSIIWLVNLGVVQLPPQVGLTMETQQSQC